MGAVRRLLLLGAAVLALGFVRPVTAAGSDRLPVRWETSAGIDTATVARCRQALAAGRERLLAVCWPYARAPLEITVHLVTTDTFRRWTAGALPDWGIGVALGGRTAVIDAWRSDRHDRPLGEVVLHELAHCLLDQAAGPVGVPRWFHEGVAQHVSGEWRWRDTVSLVLEGVPDLQDLERDFAGPQPWADRAYRTALLAVRFLQQRHGEGAVPSILLQTRTAGDFAAGFARATGEPLAGFAAAFRGRHHLRFGWLVMLTRWPGLFILLACVLMVGIAGRRWRDARRLERMEREEEALRPLASHLWTPPARGDPQAGSPPGGNGDRDDGGPSPHVH